MKVTVNRHEYQVIEEPDRHIVVPTRKELHGWWPGKRECSAERMLINPYNGCGVGCFFCYSLAFPGNFQIFREKGVVVVAKDFEDTLAQQLDSIDIAFPGYLSPVTDPFQPLNEKYHLSEKIIKIFVERNIPIEFITKAEVPLQVVDLMKLQRHSFAQVSILTLNENLRKKLVPRGASTSTLFENLERLAREGIFCVCRIDPIFPYLTDNKRELEDLIEKARSSGSSHIVASILDIPSRIRKEVFSHIKAIFGVGMERDYRCLYQERINGYFHAQIDYRKRVFDFLRNICERKKLTFALCMEYELADGEARGLNREFMSSRNCEGINIPVYARKGSVFYPLTSCTGDCLFCIDPECGIEDLAMGRDGAKKDWKLKDYRRWSGMIKTSSHKS
jgi:DNA repair photolyase